MRLITKAIFVNDPLNQLLTKVIANFIVLLNPLQTGLKTNLDLTLLVVEMVAAAWG